MSTLSAEEQALRQQFELLVAAIRAMGTEQAVCFRGAAEALQHVTAKMRVLGSLVREEES